MKLKKVLTAVAAVLSVGMVLSFAACGAKPAETTTPEQTPATDTTPKATSTLKIGATPAPHAEILEAAKPLLAAKGITLEIMEFTDYVLPNTALDAGELDANYFQHLPYLEDFNKQNSTKLVSVGAIHYEPLSVYCGKSLDFANIPDKAQIAVPNDTTNEARALQLLQANGLITIKEGVGLAATKGDIVKNPKNIEIVEMEAAQLPRTLADVDFAVINGNYALDAGIMDKAAKINDKVVSESSDSEGAKTFGNIIAVKAGNETKPEIVALMEVLQSDDIKAFINEKYSGLVVPLF